MPTCPFCETLISEPMTHFNTCELIERSRIQYESVGVLQYNSRYYCRKCFQSFEHENEWYYHRKKGKHDIGTQQQTISDLKLYSKSEADKASLSLKPPSRTSYLVMSDEQRKAEAFVKIFGANATITLEDWLKKNSQFSIHILRKYYVELIERFLVNLEKPLKILDFQELHKLYSKIKWEEFISQPEDLLDKELISQKLKHFSLSKQVKMTRIINNLYAEEYPNLQIKIPIPHYNPLKAKDKRPVDPYNFLCFIELLFRTKKKEIIHVALDLLILFQTGQRYPSDEPVIVEKITDLLANPMNLDAEVALLSIQMHKTKKPVNIAINNQLVKLLYTFKWKKFYNKRLVTRISSYFDFSMLSLRRSLASTVYLGLDEEKQRSLAALYNHSSFSVTKLYMRGGMDTKLINIVKELVVPNLIYNTKSREQLYIILPKIHDTVAKPVPKFIPKKFLDCSIWKTEEEIDFIAAEAEEIQYQEIIANNNEIEIETELELVNLKSRAIEIEVEKEIEVATIDITAKELLKENENDIVIIKNESIRMIDGNFVVEDLFHLENDDVCLKCQKKESTRKTCPYCKSSFHLKCIETICPMCMVENQQCFSGFHHSYKITQCVNLTMPNFCKNKEFIDNVKFLLGARGLRYTTSIHNIFDIKISSAKIKIEAINIPFDKYVNGNYVPPLELKISGMSSYYGTGFGIFAKEKISKDVFIGEYAADVSGSRELLFGKNDSSMNVAGLYHITPIMHSGYVPLINESFRREPNCRSMTCLIKEKIHVILYTLREISPGEELHYLYDPELNLQEYCQLSNGSAYCYYNCVFQMLKCLFSEENYQINGEENIPEIFNKMKKKRIDLASFYKKLELNELKLEVQNDAHELLLQLLNRMNPDLFRFYESSTIQCECGALIESEIAIFVKPLYPDSNKIHSYLKKESISEKLDSYKCDSCKKTSCCTKIEKAKDFGKVLFFQLLRYTNKGEKKTKAVELLHSFGDYELKALIIHEGLQTTKGHYYTVINDKRRGYVACNDDKITQISELDKNNIYLLAYKRKS